MRALISLKSLPVFPLVLALGSTIVAEAQILTPGAAAIGGTTTDAPLIGPDGQPIPSQVSPITTPPTAPTTQTVAGRTVHLPDPTWQIILPPNRGNRGVSGAVAATTTAAVVQPAATAPAAVPSPAPVTNAAAPAVPEAPAAPAVAVPTTDTTTQVTAGIVQPVPSISDEGIAITDQTVPAVTEAFERAALNFGPDGVDLTAQHEIALVPVINLMRANPLEPLRVAAVLAIADASNEDAKLLARRRILAVRRYIIEQGVNAENLSFVISANSATEPFANHVLIERIDG